LALRCPLLFWQDEERSMVNKQIVQAQARVKQQGLCSQRIALFGVLPHATSCRPAGRSAERHRDGDVPCPRHTAEGNEKAKGNPKMDVEQVRETINTAFAGLPIPNPRRLLRPFYRQEGERLRKELAGKSWQSLTSEVLARQRSAFMYLSPKAYRYYLPSLLTWAFRELPEDDRPMHSVVFGLRPSFWLLYYEGKDDDLHYQQSAFTPEQYRAVCAFLGLVFDQFPSLHHLAAQALHWGWNQYNTPALEAANKYYQEMRTFSYPEPDDPEVAQLCHEIRSAFATTPYPGDNELNGGSDKDIRDDEPAEMAMELRGIQWQSVHPQLLARCDAALSFLSNAGFRYFLPAFLLADLLDHEHGSNANPVFDLTDHLYDASLDLAKITAFRKRTDTEFTSISPQEAQEIVQRHTKWEEYRTNRLRLFNREERMAIIHYLEFCAKDQYRTDEINRALERYWRPSLQSSVE
jgi:hypothetical protein